jgi:type I restriction enzyme S subunit
MIKSLTMKSQEWDRVPLGDLCDLVNGDAYRESDWSQSGVPIIRIQNLNNRDKPFNCWAGDLNDRVVVNDGDLLLAWSGTPGTSFGAHLWNRGLGVLNQHIFRVDLDRHRLDSDWALHSINHGLEDLIGKAQGAVGLRHVTKGECKAIPILLPPLVEQRQLAGRLREQLAAVADARTALQAQLAAAAALPASHLRAVFSQAEAQQWARRDLGQCVSMLPAASISSIGEVKVQVITSACLSETGFSVAGIKTASMKRHDADRAMVAPGEVLIARSNTPELVGRVAAVPDDIGRVAASDLTIRLLPGSLLEARFLSSFLAWLQLEGFWKEKAGGASGTMKKITRGQLDTLQLPLPPLPRQRGLAAELDETFAEIATLRTAMEARLAAVERLPAALLREVFGG